MKKRCCKCKEYKDGGEFHKNKSAGDGLQYACKKCHHSANTRSKKKRILIRIKNRQCLDCGVVLNTKNKRCSECCKKRTEKSMSKYYGRKQMGLCTKCGKYKMKNNSMCAMCYNKYRNWLEADSRRRVLRAAMNSAKRRNIEINIKYDDIVIPKKCPLLGIPIIHGVGAKHDNSPSVDRIDNNKGYVKGNIWVISEKANRMKTDADPKEIAVFAKNIRRLLGKR